MFAGGNKLREIKVLVPKDAKPEEVSKIYDKYAAKYDEVCCIKIRLHSD